MHIKLQIWINTKTLWPKALWNVIKHSIFFSLTFLVFQVFPHKITLKKLQLSEAVIGFFSHSTCNILCFFNLHWGPLRSFSLILVIVKCSSSFINDLDQLFLKSFLYKNVPNTRETKHKCIIWSLWKCDFLSI